MKTLLKSRVEVNPSLVEKIGDVMSKCDLGISGILKPEFYDIKRENPLLQLWDESV